MHEPGDFLKAIDAGSPIVATAIHSGHSVRPEVARLLSISETERLREEDPFTDALARVAGTWLVGERSRFEVDLNRPRHEAIYRLPEHAWGMEIWRESPSTPCIECSLAAYDRFYDFVESLLWELVQRHGRVVVLDLHSYNHRRGGPGAPPADPAANPEVNIGTISMNRVYWDRLVDRFIADLSGYPVQDHRLDVRENVKFLGGNLCNWIHETFPDSVCAIAIEFKKCFMDEWTGRPDWDHIEDLAAALRSTFPGLRESLESMNVVPSAMDTEH